MNTKTSSGIATNSTSDKIDVAINIFAKPFQTSLSLLSLLQHSGQHIGTIWFQFEPVGSKYDPVTSYYIAQYIKEVQNVNCRISQPDFWLDLEAADPEKMHDPKYRMAIRYQYAFENSSAKLLFLMHNDVFIYKDILGALRSNLGDHFAIGQIGQCWNCPASKAEVMKEVLNCGPCSSEHYQQFRPDHEQLCAIYEVARKKGIFVRPYDVEGFDGEFLRQPWPLPECRINEWACLINLEKIKNLCIPFGPAWPPGAYRKCAAHNLDIAAPWFRDLHKMGLKATHFPVTTMMKHWVGTGNNTPNRYVMAEENALRLLKKHYPEYLSWLTSRSGKDFDA